MKLTTEQHAAHGYTITQLPLEGGGYTYGVSWYDTGEHNIGAHTAEEAELIAERCVSSAAVAKARPTRRNPLMHNAPDWLSKCVGFDATTQPPRYEHDCTTCLYLGYHHEFDLYFCPNWGDSDCLGGSVIARYGSEGSEYASSAIGIQIRTILLDGYEEPMSTLQEAVYRVISNGLVETSYAMSKDAKKRFIRKAF